jgi:predicted transcriptional regulator
VKVPSWLIPILLLFLPEKIMGFSTRRILENLPEIKKAGDAVSTVIDKLKDEGKSTEQAEKAVAEMIAKDRTMSPLEEVVWANRNRRLELEEEALRREREEQQRELDRWKRQ